MTAILIVGNGESRKSIKLNNINKASIVTYGCDKLYLEFSPSILVVGSDRVLSELMTSKYIGSIATIDRKRLWVELRNRGLSLPNNPDNTEWSTEVVATWLACTIERPKTVYLLGFDKLGLENSLQKLVLEKFPPVQYFWISDKDELSAEWKDLGVEFISIDGVAGVINEDI